jgi:hypothetical protein
LLECRLSSVHGLRWLSAKETGGNATWGDYDFGRGFENHCANDPETGTKNGEIRRAPIIPDMRQLLERLQQERNRPKYQMKLALE